MGSSLFPEPLAFVVYYHLAHDRFAIASAALLLNLNAPGTPAQAVSLPPTAILVDGTDAGFTKFGPASGWLTATSTSFNYYDGLMTWTTNVVTEPINYARSALSGVH